MMDHATSVGTWTIGCKDNDYSVQKKSKATKLDAKHSTRTLGAKRNEVQVM
jgi:hypothetical protein